MGDLDLKTRTCAKDPPSDTLDRLACQLYGFELEDKFASASSEKDGFLKMKGFVRCILCSCVSSTPGLGMIRMCENGPFPGAMFKGTGGGGGGGGGNPGIKLGARLVLRGSWPCVVHECQQFLLRSRCML